MAPDDPTDSTGTDPTGTDPGGTAPGDTELEPLEPIEAPGAAATVERYARENADRLDEVTLARVRKHATGAKAAAFFDLDKTVIARSSTLVMTKPLWRDGLIAPTTVLRALFAQIAYQLVGADHERMEQMRHAMIELTTGWEAERVRRLVLETMDDVLAPLVYAEALELFKEHRAAGRDLWIISSSGEEIVGPIADFLGVPNVIATKAGLDDQGRYDGTISFYAYAQAKANAIRQISDACGYELDDCYAYSDSITDLPMLSVVGHAVAANPDKELAAAATAMGWPKEFFIKPVSMRDRLPNMSVPKRVSDNKPQSAVGGAVIGALAAYGAYRLLRDN